MAHALVDEGALRFGALGDASIEVAEEFEGDGTEQAEPHHQGSVHARRLQLVAALLSITFLAFGLARVSFLQYFGIGTAIAILLNGTFVRGVLMPAMMRLAGAANWWAPDLLRPLSRPFADLETDTPLVTEAR